MYSNSQLQAAGDIGWELIDSTIAADTLNMKKGFYSQRELLNREYWQSHLFMIL